MFGRAIIENEPELSNKILDMSLDNYRDIRGIGSELREKYFVNKVINTNNMFNNCKPESAIFRLCDLYYYALNKFLQTNRSHYTLYGKDYDFINQEDKELCTVFFADPDFNYLKRFSYLNKQFDSVVSKDMTLKNGKYYKLENGKIKRNTGITKNDYVYREMIKTYGFYSSYLLNLENQICALNSKLVKDLMGGRDSK